MKNPHEIQNYMTPAPHVIQEDDSVAIAAEVMSAHRIRHLPVIRAGELVGIVSDRDLKIALAFRGPGTLLVGDVMTQDPFVVHPGAALDRVSGIMAVRKYGCAIVKAPGGKILGVFTDTDALRVLSEIFQRSDAK